MNQEQLMSEEQVVTYELEGEIALVGLNRPDKRNCFITVGLKQLRLSGRLRPTRAISPSSS